MRTPRVDACRIAGAAFTTALLALGAPALGAEATTPAKAADLRLTFDESAPPGGFARVANHGTARLATAVVSSGGGDLARARSRTGGGANGAARAPSLDPSADGPRAVVRVRDRRGADNLDPGTGRFAFGADFRLDPRSEDTGSGSFDNGDNLIQRGLFDAASQYKLQLDHRRAMCRMSGSAGVVSVVARQTIAAAEWYRVRCSRAGTEVTLRLTRWDSDGNAHTSVRRATGVIGSLTPDARSVPLSVAGKLSPSGRLLAATDQFNGRVDNVVVDIG